MKPDMEGHATVSVKSSIGNVVDAINQNYQSVVAMVATLMSMAADEANRQTEMGNLFNSIENMSTTDYQKQYPDPSQAPNGWGNWLYRLTHTTDPNQIPQNSSEFSANQANENALMQQLSAIVSTENQLVNQNTQAEGQTTAIGNTITAYVNSNARILG